jgi:type II secretory pathway component PulK
MVIGDRRTRGEQGSTFVLVLWIAFGLVSLAIYFASSMSFELRAANNRVSGLDADQAIEGAARYVGSVLAAQIADGSNGVVPDVSVYLSEAVPVGSSHFWLIGRDINNPVGPGQINFGLVDEASKLNLNSASSNMLGVLVDSLPRANRDVVSAILDWRSTNGGGVYQSYYSSRPQPYQSKSSLFETVDELRLLFGADMDTVIGEDANRNGILDPNETDINHNGQLDPGLLEYVTVYSREPNTRSNGQARVNISTAAGVTGTLPSLLQTALGTTRANQILLTLGLLSPGTTGPGGPPRGPPPTYTSPLQLYNNSRMTIDEFGKIANDITVTNGAFIDGRVNINTASAAVLASLPGFETNPDLAQTLVTYRGSNPDKLDTIAWIVEALGRNTNSVLPALQARDCITTRSYQYSADIAALGPNGRGYRRARFVFDTSSGVPVIVYRQDLTHLGWALGKDVRQTWLAKATR